MTDSLIVKVMTELAALLEGTRGKKEGGDAVG